MSPANSDGNTMGINLSSNEIDKDFNAPSDSVANDPDAVHILVLETDEPHPETKDRKGSFGAIFHDLFTKAGAAHKPPLKVSTSEHYVVDDPDNQKYGNVPKASEIPESVRAICLTGSMYDAHGNEPWVLKLVELLTELWKTRPNIRFSGICFGHQILARTLGSKVEPTEGKGWELAQTEMDLTEIGQKLFRTDDKKLHLHQMHQDQVMTKPDPSSTDLLSDGQTVHVWASSKHTEIQGLYIRDRLFSSQGHLGFDENMVHNQIEMREESGGIQDEEQAAEGKEKAHMEHDGLVVAAAILRFFHGEDHEIP